MPSNARFLVVAFVVSVVISLAWQYHSAQRGAVESTTVDQAAASDEAGGRPTARDLQDNDSKVSNRHPREAASGDAKVKNRDRAGPETDAAMPSYEELFVYEYDEAWVGDLYTRLHSPDPLPANEPEAVSVISGRVLTPRGRPVEGVEVTAQFRDYFKGAVASAETMAPPRPRKTKTNEQGFYAFEGLSEGTYMIGTKESSQYAEARREVHTGVKYADLVLDSQRFAIVRGVVTDPMGTELEQVRIMPLTTGLPAGTTTDSNGEFAIGVALEEGARGIPLRFRLDGFHEQRYELTEVDMAVADSVQIAVTMDPVHEYSTVSGSVSDTTRLPVAGETVRLYSPSLKRNYRAVTDEGGEYEFAKVDIADDYQLWVRPTGPYRDYTEQNIELIPGSVRRDIELDPLDRDYRLSGRILDQDGKPVPNMTLTLRSKAAAAQKLPITSDAYGEFEVENVPEGELVFESRTTPFYTVTGVRLSGNDKDRELDLVVPRGQHKLVGKVVDRNGRPIATRKIFIGSAQVIEGINARLSSSTSADAKGRFVFTDLGSGEHIITVNAPGYEGVRLHHEIGSRSGNLVVRLEQQSTDVTKASL